MDPKRWAIRAATRFWTKVDKKGPVPEHRPDLGPCWIWTASIHSSGYGQLVLKERNLKAHRVAYEWLVGPVPDGLELDHLCRVRRCVNPRHLEAVTHKVNMERGEAGVWQRKKTHCPYGHPYEGDNVYVTPDGRRYCKTCKRIKRTTGIPAAQYYAT